VKRMTKARMSCNKIIAWKPEVPRPNKLKKTTFKHMTYAIYTEKSAALTP